LLPILQTERYLAMRMVKVTVTYDMDDESKSLFDELQDWKDGFVNVYDILELWASKPETPCPVTIEEVYSGK
jgi:hypothetical protein